MSARETTVKVLKAIGNGVVRVPRFIGDFGRGVWNWIRYGTPITAGKAPAPQVVPRILLQPLQPRSGRAAPADSNASRPRLAIDLGTSSCAVALALVPDTEPFVATLSVDDADPHAPRSTIGSVIYVGDDDTLVMDERWINRYLARTGGGGGTTYRSIKRELFEHYHLTEAEREQLGQRLTSVYEELLWLALDPARSSTVKALAAAGGFENAVKQWTDKGGFEVTIGGRPVKLAATIEGFDLCICVPNSLMPSDVLVLAGAARQAAANILDALRAGDVYDPYKPVITTIREAEAVAWALPHYDRVDGGTLDLSGDVVILDVGAGTTDAALVRYGRVEGGTPSRLVEYRTGSPFGGDDLDMLLLCEAAEEFARNPPVGYQPIALPTLARNEKNYVIQRVRREKELWAVDEDAGSISVSLTGEDLSPAISVVTPTTVNIPFYTVREADNHRTLDFVAPVTSPHAGEAYQAFLRYTTYLSCASLFHRLRRHSISAIVLTGQGSLAPGIQPYVAALAGHFEISIAPDAIRHLDAKNPQVMKLVCAKGAARYVFEIDSPADTLGDIVPETFVLYHDRDRTDLFPAGSRSQRQQVNAMIDMEYPNVKRYVLHYYCSPKDLLPEDLTRDWARKPVGSIHGDPQRERLAFRLDLRKEQIHVWSIDEMGKITPVTFQPSPDVRGPKPQHPFLKVGSQPLPLTWQSMG
jgi:hypothetical protein